ncbi:carbohydrate ABC transporter permease [Subtercola boreus]|uniref:Sugar ABC transporter permease n=1 Tax=Subtercola boreus TaxID=120213 RepID=A0A3E0WBR0_9MICO|nr:carbohydrate ABC transporter permease [Subtercola boreus]RFA20569.1 sugar ABC transporter permease [Subtercola boreus]RFA20684.1 sugar ABC transporter permease [Subtercola boreus]RFA26894.1 sugar ABC transporter permease [Subtercola boreus]
MRSVANLFTGLKYLSLVVACFITLLPLVVLFITSFKSKEEYANSSPLDLPRNWFNFENFVTAFTRGNMALGFVNTTFVLVVSLVGTILIGTMTAYAIDRFEFRFKKIIIGLFLLATLIPAVTTQVATFQIVNGLGLFNSLWALIALNLGTDIVSIYIFVQFMQSIPKELDEAAMLDGASKFGIYWRVILPLLKPAIATVVIVKGIAIYNEFYLPYLYAPNPKLGVISTALFRFKGPFGSEWEIISAGAMIVIIPTLIIFLVLQRYIYNGFTQGATK